MQPSENANMAMQRLKASLPKGKGSFVPKKKNIRIKQDAIPGQLSNMQVEETKKNTSFEQETFDKLL